MHLRVIAVGKLRERYLADAVADFRARLRPYHRLEEIEIAAAPGGDAARAIEREGEAIVRVLAPGEAVWLLERTGEPFSSEELAERLERLAVGGVGRVAFVVAGTYGASEALLRRADVRWSLSRLTLLHEWARALLYEQLYRATRIARGEPYHH